jgi:Zn-dependent M16 (insulinase) family peptidase
MYLHPGGIVSSTTVREVMDQPDGYNVTFEIRSKFIFEEAEAAKDLALEMMMRTKFSDEKRLKELITAEKSHLESILSSRGNHIAATRARAGFSKRAQLTDMGSGLEFYRFLVNLEENFDSRKEEIISKLNKLCETIFATDRLIISSTGKAEVLDQSKKLLKDIKPQLTQKHIDFEGTNEFKMHPVKEALKDASQIQYVAMAGDFVKAGFKYNGAYKILNTILGYDYFWIKVRVQGGAYGCNTSFSRLGDMVFVSYRDPNLSETIKVFEETGDYLRNFEADDRDMTKYIIGTISGMDTPLTPSQRGLRGLNCYLSGITYEDLQKIRDGVLDATVEDIRALAAPVDGAMEQGYLCVVGNESVIEKNKELFTEIGALYE